VAFDLAKVDVEHMLETLELRNIRKATSDEYIYSCPFPMHDDGDRTPSAYMNTGEEQSWKATQFFCHSCKQRGDARSLVAYMLDMTPMQAGRLLRQAYDPASYDPESFSMVERLRELRERRRKKAQHEQKAMPILPEETLEMYSVDWEQAADAYALDEGFKGTDYIFRRGFTPWTLNDWQVGFCEMTDRIVIPVRDEYGNLVGLKGRAYKEDHKPKYLILGDREGRQARFGFKPYEQSQVVFGLHRAEPVDGALIIVEGELNVLALYQHGIRNAVAINGSYFSEDKARLIISRCDRAVLFLDTDNAGHSAVWGYQREDGTKVPGIVQMLHKHIRVSLTPDHDGDPADMEFDEIQACLDEALPISKVKLIRA
jgi:DNA primase